jgi:hypothetical protein
MVAPSLHTKFELIQNEAQSIFYDPPWIESLNEMLQCVLSAVECIRRMNCVSLPMDAGPIV